MSASPAKKKSCPATALELFDEVFPQLVEDLKGAGDNSPEIEDAIKWYKMVNEYNVPFGKKNRGLTVVHSYKFIKGDEATEEDLHLARIIGWCIEWIAETSLELSHIKKTKTVLATTPKTRYEAIIRKKQLQAFFLVSDDIMDGSITRRGQPCWYKKDNVGLIAINDSFYLESAIYQVLKKYIRDKPYYLNIIELFHDTTMQTITGQTLDLITAPPDHVDFTNYTMERYSAIVKWKTAFYSFYLPVASAMYMAGINGEEEHKNAKTILLQMGHFFQVQDDYLDCFGDPEVTGKVGTDIEDNKCGWLVVQALSRASPEQRALLEANYAKHDPEKVAKVKALYDELKLRDVYAAYEESSYEELSRLIDKLHGSLPKEMFIAYANKIYKRQK